MTMTREKIEDLKRLADALGGVEFKAELGEASFYVWDSEGKSVCKTLRIGKWDEPRTVAEFIAAANPQTILSLLALAERALEPQGQALPKLPDPVDEVLCYDQHSNGVAGGLITTSLPAADDYFTADQMVARYNNGCVAGYASGFAAGRASQLALPAGPVHVGPVAVGKITGFDEYGPMIEWRVHWADLVGRLLYASRTPAVAQPDNTAAWESGELGRSAEHAKRAPAHIEHQVAEAIAQPGTVTDYGTKEVSVAQPVADERESGAQ